MLLTELVFGTVATFLFIVFVVYYTRQSRKGKVPEVRRISALDDIDSSVDKCVELGKPAFCSIGGMGQRGNVGMQMAAALNILPYIVRRCANRGARLIVLNYCGDVVPLIRNIVAEGAKDEGKDENSYLKDVRFGTSDGNTSTQIGQQIIQAEDVRLVIAIGGLFSETIPYASANKERGAISIQGTAQTTALYQVAILSDYWFIGDQLYTASALLSRDPEQISTLRVADLGKIAAIAFYIIAIIAIRFGVKF